MPPEASQVPPVSVPLLNCVRVPLRVNVPESTSTVPVFVSATPRVLVPVLLSVPSLLKVSLPLLTEIVSDCRFHVAPGSLMIVAPCIWKELLPVNVAVPKFSSVARVQRD